MNNALRKDNPLVLKITNTLITDNDIGVDGPISDPNPHPARYYLKERAVTARIVNLRFLFVRYSFKYPLFIKPSHCHGYLE